MKTSDLNRIIQNKIEGLDGTHEMSEFLYLVLENELKNLHQAKGRFSSYYMESAEILSLKEKKSNVDI